MVFVRVTDLDEQTTTPTTPVTTTSFVQVKINSMIQKVL